MLVGALAGSLTAWPQAGVAVGPETIPLTVQSYEETSCPESLRHGRAGGALGAGAGAAGIAQKCVLVKAKAQNGSGRARREANTLCSRASS